MATPEPLLPSRRLRSAVYAERERLARQLERIDRRLAEVLEERNRLAVVAEDLRQRLSVLARLAHEPGEWQGGGPIPPVRAVSAAEEAPPLGFLRGAAIRTAAVRLLSASGSPDRPIHYARWYKLLRDAGYGVTGRDPLATFLTQIGRSPMVRRTSEAGMYVLDLDAITRLRERLRRCHDELLALHRGQQTIEEIASLRERRAELTKECTQIERALEEALVSLASPAGEGE